MITLFLQIFFTVFIVMDPVGNVPIFISVTAGKPLAEKRRIAVKAVTISFVVLSVFILGGRFILLFFGITPGAFYVAGGVLFFLIAIDMLFGQPKRSKTSEDESEFDETASVAVFPLAIPMISGPGTVTTIMLYSTGDYAFLPTTLMLFAAVIATLIAVLLAMRASDVILKLLGKTGVSVIERMMGLILAALSVQFVFEGFVKLGVIAKPLGV